MRIELLLPLALSLVLAGCASDYDRNTGIDCATAIRIAEQHGARRVSRGENQYQNQYRSRHVERADWDPSDNVWIVELTAANGSYGQEYKINRLGNIVGYHALGYSAGESNGPGQSDDRYYGYADARSDIAQSPVGEAPAR